MHYAMPHARKKAGTKGVVEGFQQHVSDAAEMVQHVWENVTQTTLARACMKSKILWPLIQDDFVNAFSKDVSQVHDDTDKIVEGIMALSPKAKEFVKSKRTSNVDTLQEVADFGAFSRCQRLAHC